MFRPMPTTPTPKKHQTTKTENTEKLRDSNSLNASTQNTPKISPNDSRHAANHSNLYAPVAETPETQKFTAWRVTVHHANHW
jgi:hypothetical protein